MVRSAALLVVAALVVGCGGSGTPTGSESPEALHLPPDAPRATLVVMVPGGGWRTADPTGLVGLADHLADRGVAVALADIRAAEDGVVYPAPVEDVLCEVATAAAETRAAGVEAGRVVVLGHSSGAHLAALAALAPEEHEPASCAEPLVAPDALIGISGPYDISRVPDLAVALLGGPPEEDPDAWAAANPVARAALRPEVPVLLVHGAADTVVPVGSTEQFADALEAGGHDTTVEVVEGADHLSIFEADVAGDLLVAWLDRLPATR